MPRAVSSPLQSGMSTSTVVPGQRRRIGRDRLGEGGRPTVGKVVAGHGRDDRVRQAHALHRFGHASGLVRVERERMARVDEAEPAGSRAALAVDHERRRAVGPALEDVRAAGFLADRDEVELAHRRTEPDELRADPQLTRSHSGLRLDSATPLVGSTPASDQPAIERPRRDRPRAGAGRGERQHGAAAARGHHEASWRSTDAPLAS